MNSVDALFFNGTDARAESVHLSIDAQGILIANHADKVMRYQPRQVEVSARVGNIPRLLAVPQGGQYEVKDNAWVDAWLARADVATGAALTHRLESKLFYVVLALLFTLIFSWGFFSYGLPSLSKHIVDNIPTKTDQFLAVHVLESLDKLLFKPSKLAPARQEQLRQSFAVMVSKIPASHPYQLVFRSSPKIGANAFALPSGMVVMTDELVALAENDQEIYAILAHEMGHVHYRHGLRTVLQSSAVLVIISLVVGDIGTSAGLLATLPTLLLESKYSRNFETEADHFAFEYMQAQAIDTQHFANIMRRLTADSEAEESEFQYIASHPQTVERIRAFETGQWQ